MKKITYFSLIYHVVIKFITIIGSFISFNVIANHLGTTQYGYWAQISSASNLLIPLVLLQLPISYLRFFSSERNRSDNAMGSMILVNWAVFGFICLVFYAFDGAFAELIFGNKELTGFLTLLLIYVFFKCNLQMLMTYFRASGNTNLYSNLLLAESVIQILLLLLLVIYLDFALVGVVYSFVLVDGAIVVLLILWMLLVKKNFGLTHVPSYKSISQFLQYSLPLVPHMFLFWVINLSDRFFLVHYHGIDVAGIYNAIYLFGNLLIVFQVAVNFIVLPEAIRLWEDNQKYAAFNFLRLLQNLYMVTGIFIVGLFTVSGVKIIQLIGTNDFTASRLSIFMITMGCLLVGTDQFLRNIFHLYKKTRILPLLFSASAVTNVTINLLLIPHLGMEGAAFSTLVTFSVQYLIFSYMAYRMALFKLDPAPVIKTALLVAAISLGIVYAEVKYPVLVTTVIFGLAYLIVVFKFNWIDLRAIRAALLDKLPRE